MLRLIGKILTLTVVGVGGFIVLGFYLAVNTHLIADSEVGMMVYGMQMICAFIGTTFATCLTTLLWGVGIRLDRKRKSVPLWEIIIHKILFFLSSFLSALMLGFQLYRMMVRSA